MKLETKDLCQAHLALPEPFLPTAQCSAAPRWRQAPGGVGTDPAVPTVPPEMVPAWHWRCISWHSHPTSSAAPRAAGVAATTPCSVLCRLAVWPQAFLQSLHFSAGINTSAEKNPVSEESCRKWTGCWKEELGCCLDPAITLIHTKTSFSLFALPFPQRLHDGLLSVWGIWQVCGAARRGWCMQASILLHLTKQKPSILT